MSNEVRGTDVAQRIATLIESLGMKTADFADKVGIQKSAVSHLIGGRNKPSFEVIGSMLQAFPELNPDWLILGKGDMWRKVETVPSTKNSLQNQRAHSTSLKELVNAAPLPNTTSHTQIQNTESVESKPILKHTNVNSVQDLPSTSSDKPQIETIPTPIQNVASTPNSNITSVITETNLPDIVVLQPDGRYIRYRAIKE
ncbi:MAG: helix-turn-helix domain-containing protein [Bacteroides sp.]